MNTKWTPVLKQLPDENILVDTKIDDMNGARNKQRLRRRGNLWFVADGSMYVYYAPTHWKQLEQ